MTLCELKVILPVTNLSQWNIWYSEAYITCSRTTNRGWGVNLTMLAELKDCWRSQVVMCT